MSAVKPVLLGVREAPPGGGGSIFWEVYTKSASNTTTGARYPFRCEGLVVYHNRSLTRSISSVSWFLTSRGYVYADSRAPPLSSAVRSKKENRAKCWRTCWRKKRLWKGKTRCCPYCFKPGSLGEPITVNVISLCVLFFFVMLYILSARTRSRVLLLT